LVATTAILAGCSAAPSQPEPEFSPDAGIASSAGDLLAPSGAVTALIEVPEDLNPLVSQITANSGFITVFSASITVAAGDVLRIRGQVEVTNTGTVPIAGVIRTVVNGTAVGTTSAENVLPCCGTHHMPLWTDAAYVAPSAGTVTVAIQYEAQRSDSSPVLVVEGSQYSHLVTEHYRTYASTSAADSAGAYVLAGVTPARTASILSFGVPAYTDVSAYQVSVPVIPGDRVRLLGQATTGYTTSVDMQAQGIWHGATLLSPSSTENMIWELQTTPLFTDAVHPVTAAETASYQVKLHSADGIGGSVVASGGHLYAMRFTPITSALHGSFFQFAGSSDVEGALVSSILVNSGWRKVGAASVTLAAGEAYRLTSYVQLEYPSAVTSGISCEARLRLLDASGTVVDTAEITQQYVTADLENLQLRNELLGTVATAGTYSANVALLCALSSSSPRVPVDNVSIVNDSFSPISLP
jgi:hypothetical protein